MQFSAADVPRVDARSPHLGLCRRGFNLIGKIQPVLIGWNAPDGVERWRNQAAELLEPGSGVRGDELLKVGNSARCRIWLDSFLRDRALACS